MTIKYLLNRLSYFGILLAFTSELAAETPQPKIVQNASRQNQTQTSHVLDAVTFGMGADSTILPLSLREHINWEPGIFFILGWDYRYFSYDVYVSMAWPRSRGAFDREGFLWPENSTSFIVDISGNIGYGFWPLPKLQIKPAVGFGNTQVGLFGKENQARFTTLNFPLSVNLSYFFDHEGQAPTLEAYSRLRYALFCRSSYAYWPDISPQEILGNGVWHTSAGLTVSFTRREIQP